MSNENTPAQQPVLRNNDLALWPTKEGSKAALSGYVTIEDQKVQVVAFINDTDKGGNQLAHPYITLSTNTAGEGEQPKWKNVAIGNAMNQRKDGKQVFFDQVIFNVAGSEKTFNAYVGRGITEDLHKQLGFTSPQVPRPEKEPAPAPAPAPAEEEEESSAPRP